MFLVLFLYQIVLFVLVFLRDLHNISLIQSFIEGIGELMNFPQKVLYCLKRGYTSIYTAFTQFSPIPLHSANIHFRLNNTTKYMI
jgi:hypothetical protein